jgi:hypothetical protein
MDEIVEAALRKWPNVPHCHGWLALDARGDWYMRDERVQAAGPFPQVKGSVIRHDKLLGFIHRNYAADADGAWYFQNGPQRVYVELEAAPWVWRVQAGAAATARGQRRTPGATPSCSRPGWTIAGGCSCSPISASASCTRSTWARPATRSRPAPGRCTNCRSTRCRRASATACDPQP